MTQEEKDNLKRNVDGTIDTANKAKGMIDNLIGDGAKTLGAASVLGAVMVLIQMWSPSMMSKWHTFTKFDP